ncbi:hypothetical protein NPX13_g7276 [Xylaria arbuscula]|uniref:Uncharacterized protein n=1 Tax=Xylaria arbuscula TaxID=114810 RepID=A0A9W8NB00_9PEZI|nr:hypothetical protein NPX13_g7276 [Xylaria arbuscula]
MSADEDQKLSDSCLSISVQPSPHNDNAWREFPEDVRNYVVATKPFVFPDLRQTLKRTLNDLACDSIEFEGANTLPYSAMIHQNGGVANVLEHLMNMVLSEINALVGLPVTPALLQEVKEQQSSEWTRGGGYIDFVTDDRNPLWLRLYVGQYTIAIRRILRQHSQNILKGSYESLHYFILWMGNGHRSAKFIRLWQFPDSCNDTWYKVRANILEYCFCVAFRSLVTTQEDDGNRALVGLNVLSPLIQGGGKSIIQCLNLRASKAMRGAADAQIKCWPDFRQGIKTKRLTLGAKPRTPPRLLFRIDYLTALKDAGLNPEVIELFQGSLLKAATKVVSAEDLRETSLASLPIIGSLTAKVGFVLDFESCPPAIGALSSSSHEITVPDRLPWTIASSGFTTSNALVWTPHFTQISTLHAVSVQQLSRIPLHNTTCLADHKALIHNSQISMIILCGERAKYIVPTALGLSASFDLFIGDFSYELWVYNDLDSDHTRLLISSPELPADVGVPDMITCSKISELLRLVVSLTGLKEIRPYFIETTSVFRQIFRGMVHERRGLPAMTSDNIPEGIRLWLHRKGMGSLEHIRKIESIAGSLNWGLLMVVGALSRAKRRSSQAVMGFCPPKKRQRLNEPFDPTVFAIMKAFVAERLDKENEVYHQKLNGLGRETETAGVPVTSSLASECFSAPREGLPITKDNSTAAMNTGDCTNGVDAKIQEFIENCWQDQFEPEYEADINFVEQLSTFTMGEPESDGETQIDHLGATVDKRFNENRLDIQGHQQNGDTGPMMKTRNRTGNIPVIPIQQLNGSQVRVSNSGTLQLRYEVDGSRKAIDVNLGKSVRPSSQDHVRSVHFTDRGIDIRTEGGQSIIHPTRSNGGTTLPLEELRNLGSGEALLALYRRVMGLDAAPELEGKPIPTKPLNQQPDAENGEAPVERDALWLLKQYVDKHFPNGGDFWP